MNQLLFSIFSLLVGGFLLDNGSSPLHPIVLQGGLVVDLVLLLVIIVASHRHEEVRIQAGVVFGVDLEAEILTLE